VENLVITELEKATYWRRLVGDKSRVLWLKEGDKCTKFFSTSSQVE
jgi:hypothetical protein